MLSGRYFTAVVKGEKMIENLVNIRVVLVNTSHPGNIGGVARAMKNMGLQDLVLVAPEKFPDKIARVRASGAIDVLDTARVVDTLDEAVADCTLVVGASARLRAIPWPTIDPRECAERSVKMASSHHVALVMGRENSGLRNDELERCHFLVHIPANPEYSSLNLATAVQVLAYEIRVAALATEDVAPSAPTSDYPLVTASDMEGLYSHFSTALQALDFYDPANPRQLMRRLRRLFNRVQLDKMELNILRGILSAAEAAVKAQDKG